MNELVHSIWTFLCDKTVCGKPIIKVGKRGVLKNIALELEDITCPECRAKKEKAYAS